MVPELGVIEGYFGRPWGHEDRKRVLTQLRDLGYAWFHHAPKADAFLRRRWREPHPPAAFGQLADLSAHCRSLGMRFGIGLSPYELYRDYSGRSTRSASTISRSCSTTHGATCLTWPRAKPRSCTPRWPPPAPAGS